MVALLDLVNTLVWGYLELNMIVSKFSFVKRNFRMRQNSEKESYDDFLPTDLHSVFVTSSATR